MIKQTISTFYKLLGRYAIYDNRKRFLFHSEKYFDDYYIRIFTRQNYEYFA